MRNPRITQTPSQQASFGLVAWLEQTKVELPLKGVECFFTVRGDVVRVELDQIFQQNNKVPLDCLYTFPLPAGAAVYRCDMHINGRVVRARVEEEAKALEIVKEKKAAGYRTGLVEMVRDNLFTISLGNVQPNDLVVIRFAWFETVSRLGDWTSLRIPFCPGVRYIPGEPLLRSSRGKGMAEDTDQVPDASRLSPPRMDRLHADAAYMHIDGMIEHAPREIVDLSSPSHPVLLRYPTDRQTSVSLADKSSVPDGDFTLRWTEANPAAVTALGWVTPADREGNAYALMKLRAPTEVAAQNHYSQDFYFLVDRSGSMEGLKWKKAVEALHEFVKVMGEGSRIWLTFFESSTRDFSERPMKVAELRADEDFAAIESLGATGGTEMLPAVQHVLGKVGKHSEGRSVSIILITDGEIGNEQALLSCLSQHSGVRVHVFGIDTTLNDGFLRKLGAQNHGSSCMLSPRDDIAGAVRRLGQRLGRPALTNLSIPDCWETPTGALPDLHAGEVALVPLRCQGLRSSLEVRGLSGDGKACVQQVQLTTAEDPAFALLWSRQRIDWQLAAGKRQEAILLAKKMNLICEGTTFVAWDEKEQVAVSSREIYQPSLQPVECNLLEDASGICFAPPSFSLKSGLSRCFSPGAEFKRESALVSAALDKLIQACRAPSADTWLRLAEELKDSITDVSRIRELEGFLENIALIKEAIERMERVQKVIDGQQRALNEFVRNTGLNARSWRPRRIDPEQLRDLARLAEGLADALSEQRHLSVTIDEAFAKLRREAQDWCSL